MYLGILLALLLTETVFVVCNEDTLIRLKREELGDMIHYAIKFPKVLKMLMEGFDNNIASAVNNFGDNLYKQVAKEEGNVIISPFSVHSGLSMLALGVSQSTLDELLSYLFFKNVNVLKMSYLSFHNEHRNASKKNFIVANSVFVNRRYTLVDSFKDDAANVFDAEVRNVDFSKPRVAASIINDWIATKTNRKISSIVSETALGRDVVALLLNAIYFKGTWKMKFDPVQTVKSYEFQTENNVTFCNMMKMEGTHFNYLEDSSFKLLELDMSDDNIKIAFVKPSYPNVTLADVENELTASLFFAKIKNADKIRLRRILIPRLQIMGDYRLKTSLQSMGIKEIFEFANLEKMLLNPLATSVAEVNHKAIMEINEEGVVAAAASSVKIVARSGRSKGPEFVLDQPFMVFLYCKKTEIIVFKGRVKNPGTFLPPPKREIKPNFKKQNRKKRW